MRISRGLLTAEASRLRVATVHPGHAPPEAHDDLAQDRRVSSDELEEVGEARGVVLRDGARRVVDEHEIHLHAQQWYIVSVFGP